jgi:predicted lipoprotein with Yx(FWY)xxD motif
VSYPSTNGGSAIARPVRQRHFYRMLPRSAARPAIRRRTAGKTANELAGSRPVNQESTGVVVRGMSTPRGPGAGLRIALRLAGAGLLFATAAIHLDLYLTGYRTIPTIGWLFLLQIIAAFGLGALVLVTGSRLAAAAGAGFALSTLGGYLLTVQFGLFGFREVRTTAGIVAGIIEVAAFAALAALAVMPGRAAADSAGGLEPAAARRVQRDGSSATLDSARMSSSDATAGSRSPMARWARGDIPYAVAVPAVAAIAVVALGLLGGALAGAGSTGGGQGTTTAGAALRTENIGGVTVLANAQGRTLYWFAPDTSTTSVCNGSCAQYWPPVAGPDHAGNGVAGTLATIHRADGSLQETYNGHPLYTYVGDTGPGQAHGNNVNLNGGLWHEVVVSG